LSSLNYSSYLKIESLLSLPTPQTNPEERVTYSAEHFFIVTHQTSELWLSQVLLDLSIGTTELQEGRYIQAAEVIERCAVVIEMMTGHLNALSTMLPTRFREFRSNLGTASGRQSVQFHSLDRELGMDSRHQSPLFEALEDVCGRTGIDLDSLVHSQSSQPNLSRVVSAMLELSRQVWKWKATHVELVVHMIGTSERGTGDTSGAHFLATRLDMPFPRLWEAVSRTYH